MTDAPAPNGPDASSGLVPLLEETASELGGVLPRRDAGGITWIVDARPIASVEGPVASFRIGREIGAAARNTPDASASALGPDWVAFQPATLDGHARDRAVAWLAAAHRLARRG